ncbi:PAS-domain containing protein, partial [Phaeobacter sp. HF9A]|uniref:PAS-domain containing protein n=1 Tax=Phaeobacter sp. HF9A TaxID=2721561 RepID=UPI00158DCA55
MRLGRTLALFALILAVLTGMSFIGYRYLMLANEYRARNLVHLETTQDILTLLGQTPVLRPKEAAELEQLVLLAGEQARWCLDNLSMTERNAFLLLGAGEALKICEAAIKETDAAMNILAPLKSPDAVYVVGESSPFVRNLQLTDSMRKLRKLSLSFRPQLDIIEDRLVQVVQTVTAIASFCLAMVFVVLSRQMIRTWKVQTEQTLELNRISHRMTAAMDASKDGFAIYDEENLLVICNDTYRELCHVNPEMVQPGMHIRDLTESALRAGHYALDGKSAQQYLADYDQKVLGEKDWLEVTMELAGDRHILSRV